MKKYKEEKILTLAKLCITILLLVQPFFDIIKTSKIQDIQIFGFSFFEIFNIIMVAILGFFSILHSQHKKKIFMFSLFGVLFLIYFGLHCYNMILFNNDIYSKHTLNFLVEFYYLYKTFVNPFILMLSLY